MMAHVYNLSTWETEAGGMQVQGQLGLHSEQAKLYRETPAHKNESKNKQKSLSSLWQIV
jgi:hypothetical protein